jgi:hypothetical protein
MIYADLNDNYQSWRISKILELIEVRKNDLKPEGERYLDRAQNDFGIDDRLLVQVAQYHAKRCEPISSINDIPNTIITKIEKNSFLPVNISFKSRGQNIAIINRVNYLIKIIEINAIVNKLENILMAHANTIRPM